MTPPLVNTPAANAFREMAGTHTGRKVLLGDTATLPKEVHLHVTRADEALVNGMAKVAKLPDDPTKTPVVMHETGGLIAAQTIAVIEDSKAKIEAHGEEMMTEATAEIHARFTLKQDRAMVYERVISWINSKANDANGPTKIREAMRQDPDIVTVLTEYPPYLFELAPDVRMGIVIDGYQHHMPLATERVVQGQKLVETAGKYDRVIAGVKASFYNKAMAAQASRRVEA